MNIEQLDFDGWDCEGEGVYHRVFQDVESQSTKIEVIHFHDGSGQIILSCAVTDLVLLVLKYKTIKQAFTVANGIIAGMGVK